MSKNEINVSAPGRLCLLGEHQDYFGLPILAAAINLRISIHGKKRADRKLKLELPDIGERDEFPLDKKLEYSQRRDYLKSAVNILQREQIRIPSGWDCTIKGTIPINSGTASSSALVVAWVKFLIEAIKDERAGNPNDIAELAFFSEVAEFKEPGGKMDHYASALGGIISIHFGRKLQIKKHHNRLKEFVLADSLIRKDTTGTLGFLKRNVIQGMERIQNNLKNFDLKSTLGPEEKEEIEKLPPVEKRLLTGTLMTREITAEGIELFDAENFNQAHFGQLLTRQQEVIRDYLQISVPKIDRMIDTALKTGALGAKLNGSGEGGCMFAYTPGKSEEVFEALKKLGAKPFIVLVDEGVRTHET